MVKVSDLNCFSTAGYTLELNPDVGSLDLLHLDITNEAVLRGRLFKKVPTEVQNLIHR